MAKKSKKQKSICEDCSWRNGQRCYHPQNSATSLFAFSGQRGRFPVDTKTIDKCQYHNDKVPILDALEDKSDKPYWFLYYLKHEKNV